MYKRQEYNTILREGAKEKISETNTHIASVEGEQFILIENTCAITNDNYKKAINIKEEKEIKVNKTYLINSDIPIAVSYTHLDVYKRQVFRL